MLDWCLRQSTSHRVSVVYHSYGGMMDMWHRNIFGTFKPSSTRSRARGRIDIIREEFSRRRLCDPTLCTKIFANFPTQCTSLDLNLGPSQLSVHRWTSTGDLPSSVCTTRPQPGTCPALCVLLGLNGEIKCQKICQIKCHEICQIECQKRYQIKYNKIYQIKFQNIYQIKCQIKYQIKCHKICQKICQIKCQKIC